MDIPDLECFYNNLYANAISSITNNNYELDNLINSPNDKRFGITLIIKPPLNVVQNIIDFLSDIKTIEPNQYYYPETDIHITVLSVISCHTGFIINNINLPDYIMAIKQAINNNKPFNIEFKGVTASPSCVMVQGFFDNTLAQMRDKLRQNLIKSGLTQTIDKRYKLVTAHSTVIRFCKNINNTNTLVNKLEQYRNHNFGTFTVNQIHLVYNDWYQRASTNKTLFTFEL